MAERGCIALLMHPRHSRCPNRPTCECKSGSPNRRDFLSPDRHIGGGRTVVGNQTDRLFMAVFTTATEITVFPGGRWSAAWNITVHIYYADRRRRRRDGQTGDVPRQSIKRQERRPIRISLKSGWSGPGCVSIRRRLRLSSPVLRTAVRGCLAG